MNLYSGDTPEQRKIRSLVAWYKRRHSSDYRQFCKIMQMKRDLNPDQFARLEGSPHRGLHEIPEVMFEQLVIELTPEEMAWFSTNDTNRWFAKEFPEFSLARTI